MNAAVALCCDYPAVAHRGQCVAMGAMLSPAGLALVPSVSEVGT